VFATTARSRHISLPVSTPRAAAEEIRGYDGKIAIVFGRENSGLSNEELSSCNRIVNIPSNPDFASLNIAQAVQICLYEIRSLLTAETEQPSFIPKGDRFAFSHEIKRLENHLEEVMRIVDYFDPVQPKHLHQRIHRFFSRFDLLRSEVQIIRGFLRFVVRKVKQFD
jgi:TrmH family RNA methyltransferase